MPPRDLAPYHGLGFMANITRRHFIRNGTVAVASLSTRNSVASAGGADTDTPASRVLLVYNASSKDGYEVANYYKVNRPGMSGVDTLAVTADTTEKTTYNSILSQ